MDKIDIEELYWSDLDELVEKEEELNEVLSYIKDFDSRTIKEISQILKLYSNPSGALTEEFAKIITDIYKYDKIKFMKALALDEDEAMNLTYVFRNLKIFEDEDKEYEEISKLNKLTEDELTVANMFFKMYKTICSSWL